ncbi:hypothetical protein Tdes44962_MAKER10145 [Teratosphaeria destructans]|uniref:Uncharacterized protein n=1 Tax=Teratosphaeria destructans TaxID=418781 RepID=A0A9W7SNG0_9PEZI|nr:hypothetical protein Tdes44962_MAKER10145 [Teratosphaeria destructans]
MFVPLVEEAVPGSTGVVVIDRGIDEVVLDDRIAGECSESNGANFGVVPAGSPSARPASLAPTNVPSTVLTDSVEARVERPDDAVAELPLIPNPAATYPSAPV